MDIEGLTERGFVEAPYPRELRKCVDDAMHAWQIFCTLPHETKVMFSGGDRIRDFGYMRRTDGDNKELFHVSGKDTPALERCAREFINKQPLAFIDALDALIQSATPLVQQFAERVEYVYDMPGFTTEVMEAADRWTFRYLHYFGGDEALADPHVDRGGFTLHLRETHPGGEYLDFDRRWQSWPISDAQTIIFPSMGFQYRSSGILKALWHQVKPIPETQSGDRFSMVVFVDFHQPVEYDQRNGRLQEFEPGFNYDMPFAEFAKLFMHRELA